MLSLLAGSSGDLGGDKVSEGLCFTDTEPFGLITDIAGIDLDTFLIFTVSFGLGLSSKVVYNANWGAEIPNILLFNEYSVILEGIHETFVDMGQLERLCSGDI